ncbi:MAG TPA: hypothetical protein VIE66_17735 [Methylocella sp.]|jgi:hypothetical protein
MPIASETKPPESGTKIKSWRDNAAVEETVDKFVKGFAQRVKAMPDQAPKIVTYDLSTGKTKETYTDLTDNPPARWLLVLNASKGGAALRRLLEPETQAILQAADAVTIADESLPRGSFKWFPCDSCGLRVIILLPKPYPDRNAHDGAHYVAHVATLIARKTLGVFVDVNGPHLTNIVLPEKAIAVSEKGLAEYPLLGLGDERLTGRMIRISGEPRMVTRGNYAPTLAGDPRMFPAKTMAVLLGDAQSIGVFKTLPGGPLPLSASSLTIHARPDAFARWHSAALLAQEKPERLANLFKDTRSEAERENEYSRTLDGRLNFALVEAEARAQHEAQWENSMLFGSDPADDWVGCDQKAGGRHVRSK